MDTHGVVTYVGTFSKTLLPELRLGYAVLPPAIYGAVLKAKQLTDQHSSTLPQWALAKFISEGYLLKHIRRCHTVYAGRRERILQRLAGIYRRGSKQCLPWPGSTWPRCARCR